jgi:hypothetical protein
MRSLCFLSMLALPASALAQDGPGLGISAGAGVTGFVDDNLRDTAGLGAAWELRVVVGTRSMLAIESAYIGSARNVDLLVDDVTLMSHGLEANGRLNIGVFPVQPYVIGGLGWSRYMLYNQGEMLDIRSDDDILTVPLGAGVSFYAASIAFDIRGTYRLAYDDELFREDITDFEERPAFDSWSLTARAGLEF